MSLARQCLKSVAKQLHCITCRQRTVVCPNLEQLVCKRDVHYLSTWNCTVSSSNCNSTFQSSKSNVSHVRTRNRNIANAREYFDYVGGKKIALKMTQLRPNERSRQVKGHFRARHLQWSVVSKLHQDVFECSRYENTVFVKPTNRKRHIELTDFVGNNPVQLSNQELKDCLVTLAGSENYSNKTQQSFDSLEQEFCHRLQGMKLEDILFIADAFISSKCKAVHLVDSLLLHIESRWDGLGISTQDLTQICFFIAVHGRCNIELLSHLETFIEKKLDDFLLKEVALICLGFYRAKCSFRSYSLLDGIASRVLQEYNQLHTQALNGILKQFRHAGYLTPSFYDNLANLMCTKYGSSDSININSEILQLIRSYASVRVYNDSLMTTAHQLLMSHVLEKKKKLDFAFGESRGKDIAKMFWGFATFGFDVDQLIIDSLIEDFNWRVKIGEVEAFPEVLVDFLVALAYLGHYPESLLDCLFTKKILDFIWAHPLKSKKDEANIVYRSALIEHPTYENPETEAYFKTFDSLNASSTQKYIELELSRRTGLRDILNSLTQLLPGWNVQCNVVLSHFKTASLIVERRQGNEINTFTVTPDSAHKRRSLSKRPQGGSSVLSQLLKEKDEVTMPWIHNETEECAEFLPSTHQNTNVEKKFAIEVHGFNQYTSGQPRLLGLHRMKLRQLRRSGYVVIVIPPGVATKISTSSESERQQFLTLNVLPLITKGKTSQS